MYGPWLKLTKRTRVCFRDAFFRLAESSSAKCGAANGTPPPSSATATATGGRISTPGPGRPERETNAIDRTVADLTMRPAVLASRCPADGDSGAEAHSATTDRHDDGVERAPRDWSVFFLPATATIRSAMLGAERERDVHIYDEENRLSFMHFYGTSI